MEKLRLNKKELNTVIAELSRRLENCNNYSKFRFNGGQIKDQTTIKKPTLIINTTAYIKMFLLVDSTNNEISWHGLIDKKIMAAKIFAGDEMLKKVNDIIHPAVKDYLLSEREKEQANGKIDYFFIEAALLIECGYKAYVDEMWYIYSPVEVRMERLKNSRGYSQEKIESIIAAQLTEDEFRAGSDFVIDNTGDLEETYKQIKNKMSKFYL